MKVKLRKVVEEVGSSSISCALYGNFHKPFSSVCKASCAIWMMKLQGIEEMGSRKSHW